MPDNISLDEEIFKLNTVSGSFHDYKKTKKNAIVVDEDRDYVIINKNKSSYIKKHLHDSIIGENHALINKTKNGYFKKMLKISLNDVNMIFVL